MNSYALVNEVSDEKRFKKVVGGALGQVRNLVGDGLFTVSPILFAADPALKPTICTTGSIGRTKLGHCA